MGAVAGLNDILHGLEPSLGPVGGAPAPLEGGITNRNYKVRFGEVDYVVRLHGKDTDLLGISRKYAIPLMEYFDAQRITVRQGERRVLRGADVSRFRRRSGFQGSARPMVQRRYRRLSPEL